MADATGKGLEGVVAAQTRISDVDGREGKLFYAGYDIADLAAHATFEETIHLLHHLELPTAAQLSETVADPAGGEHPRPAAGRAGRLPGRADRPDDHPADGGVGRRPPSTPTTTTRRRPTSARPTG